MKTALLALSLSFCVAARPALAQMQPPTPTVAELRAAGTAPSKGDNTILLVTADSVGVAWRTIREMLLNKGYSLAQNDEGLHSFTTAPKTIQANRQLTINGFVRRVADGRAEIALSGAYSYVTPVLFTYGTATLSRPLIWAGGAMGEDTAMFKLMQSIAIAYPRMAAPTRYIVR